VVIDPFVNDAAPGERAVAFARFVRRHGRELGRLAYLLLGDRDAADDLVGDAFLAAWQRWDVVRDADHPLAYVRRLVVNLAGTRIRRTTRERRRLLLFHGDAAEAARGTDTDAVVDVRSALARLPARRRACVVLRYGFDVPEREVARILGVSVGTVKSQTSKGVAQLRPLLGAAKEDSR